MEALRDLLAHGIMALVGIVSGALSAVALAIAALAAAVLGMCALLFSPLRELAERIRGG